MSTKFRSISSCKLATAIFATTILSISHGCSKQLTNDTNEASRNMNFKFEDHGNAEDAQRELVKIFPIGSDSNILIKEMKRINARCVEDETGATCTYIIPISIATGHSWSVSINVADGKTTKMDVRKNPTAL